MEVLDTPRSFAALSSGIWKYEDTLSIVNVMGILPGHLRVACESGSSCRRLRRGKKRIMCATIMPVKLYLEWPFIRRHEDMRMCSGASEHARELLGMVVFIYWYLLYQKSYNGCLLMTLPIYFRRSVMVIFRLAETISVSKEV
jgi:hypothetical protein